MNYLGGDGLDGLRFAIAIFRLGEQVFDSMKLLLVWFKAL